MGSKQEPIEHNLLWLWNEYLACLVPCFLTQR